MCGIIDAGETNCTRDQFLDLWFQPCGLLIELDVTHELSLSVTILASKLDLLETIDSGMKIQVDVDSIRNKNAIVYVGETLGIELLELLEERGTSQWSISQHRWKV